MVTSPTQGHFIHPALRGGLGGIRLAIAYEQLKLFDISPESPKSVELLPLSEYQVIVCSSGGKDSVASMLALFEMGVTPEQMQIHHQLVDGDHRTGQLLFDWPVSTAYVTAIADHFNIPLHLAWRDDGLLTEMMRTNARTADVYGLSPEGELTHLPTTKGKYSTRRKWPAITASLSTRYCSAAVKIDVHRRLINNLPEYQGTITEPKKLLIVTGERRQESANRAKYLEKEVHACNSKSRTVHAFRPVIDWDESEVWAIFKRYRLQSNPVYHLGFSRLSCQACVFFSPDHWAMIRYINPELFNRLVILEKELNHTIDAKMDLETKANMGSLNRMPLHDVRLQRWIESALSTEYDKKDLIVEGEWELPAGAFGAGGGPS